MSEKTRSIKTKDVTDEEARDYLLQMSALLNEINRLEEEKADWNALLNKQIKTEQGKLEALRVILNDGVVITVHNFMDKDTHQIIWKDNDGNEVERTPFDEQDWEIYDNKYGPEQRPLFDDEKPTGTPGTEMVALDGGDIIEGECEDMPGESPSDDHGEDEAEPEGPPEDTPEIHEYRHLDEGEDPNEIKT